MHRVTKRSKEIERRLSGRETEEADDQVGRRQSADRGHRIKCGARPYPVHNLGETERLWTTCLNAGIDYRECEKRELIALIHRDPQFSRFEDEIEFARSVYDNSKSALDGHLTNHGCWRG